jgi:TRAP-type mannitol/chloroaromatic compound transport system permease small subunit
METETKNLLEAQQIKIDAIYKSVEKTRKYLLWTMIATVAFFVLPLIGLMFVVPSFISSYTSSIDALGQ